MLTDSGCAIEYRVCGARVKMGEVLKFEFTFIPLHHEGSFSKGEGGADGMRSGF